jgi:hypothetical protein
MVSAFVEHFSFGMRFGDKQFFELDMSFVICLRNQECLRAFKRHSLF